jgi:small subunit ribosomal protein S23
LHLHHAVPLSQAYRAACQQYAALRSEHTISSHIAYLEAKAYGATFPVSASAIRRGYELEEKALEKWGKDKDQDVNELVARKKWRVVVDKSQEDVGAWTKGQEYARKVSSGERPTYKIGRVDSWASVLPDGAKVDRSSPIEGEDEEFKW